MAELLLRLFQSDFFSPALGVSYLRFYSESIGITWHLIHLLRTRYPAEDLAFYWPQLCHLLLTTPHSDSLALETYILDIAAADPHTALITSWIFQAALRDLSSAPNTPSFRICQRILNHCHHILFHTPDLDHFLLASATESLQQAQLQQSRQKRELLERESHTRLLQQLGASSSDSDVALSLPAVAPSSGSGKKQLQQQQQQRPFLSAPPSPPQQSSASPGGSPHNQPYLRPATSSFLLQQLPSSLLPALLRRSARPKVLPSNALTTLVGAGAILASAPGQPLLAKETAMVAVLQGMRAHDRNQIPTRLTEHGDEVFDENEEIDPNLGPDGRLPLFGIQRPVPPKNPAAVPGPPQPPPTPLAAAIAPRPARLNHAPASASASSIFLPGSGPLARGGSSSSGGKGGSGGKPYINIAALPKAYLSSLLRTHYFRAQTRMLQQFQDISARLLLHPKQDRLAALRSELTSLNHTLPSEVCLPMWCECGPDASTTSAIARAELNASAALAAAEAAEEGGDPGSLFDESRFQLLNGSNSSGGAAQSTGASKKDASAASAAAAPSFLSESVTKPPIRHHRIVRISPSESVVLNSADRAPYLLHVEVLRNDLDFDPERRGNRELCERLVRGEEEGRARRDRRRETSGSGGPGSASGSAGGPHASSSNGNWEGSGNGPEQAGGQRFGSRSSASSIASPRSRHPSSSPSLDAHDASASRLPASGGRAGDKALPNIPAPLVSSATLPARADDDDSLASRSAGAKGSSSSAASGSNAPIAGLGTNPASGINPMSEVGPGPSPAMADPD
ncbi:Phosphatidylinositol 4-kinase pik1alpha (PI4-kinase)(PtdIns-4-kinase), partial [Tilletia horrida]